MMTPEDWKRFWEGIDRLREEAGLSPEQFAKEIREALNERQRRLEEARQLVNEILKAGKNADKN